MTQPWQHNCAHSSDGWCFKCASSEFSGLWDALMEIEQSAHNPDDCHPDLVGRPDRYEELVNRLGAIALSALMNARKRTK